MKTKLLFIAAFLSAVSTLYAQEAQKELFAKNIDNNYQSFTVKQQQPSTYWLEANKRYAKHPDAGFIPAEQPENNLVEIVDKRTENTRYYTDPAQPTRVLSQGAYSPMHYRKDGQWLAIDARLDNKGNGIIEASRQIEPVGFDIGKKVAYIKTTNGTIYFNNWKLYGSTGTAKTLLATANWSDYSAGDNGIYINNIFPGVDAEMEVRRGSIKTNLIVRSFAYAQYDDYIFADSYDGGNNASLLPQTDVLQAGAEMNFKSGDKLLAHIGKALVYSKRAPDNVQYHAYDIDGMEAGIVVSNNSLQMMLQLGDVIIDPLVTGATATLPQGTPLNSYNNAGCNFNYNTGCGYTWAVPVPAGIKVTTTKLQGAINTYAPCTRDMMRWQYHFNGTCGAGLLWNTAGNPASPGGTAFYSETDLYSYCFTPSCTQYNASVTLYISRSCQGPAGCENTCVAGTGPFTMTIEGRTVELPPANVYYIPSGVVCSGKSIYLNASPTFGVPPYSYTWNPGNLTGNYKQVTPPTGNTTYTLTVNDACNNTATGSIPVSVTAVPAAPTVTISASTGNTICDGTPVTFTANAANAGAVSYQWRKNGINVGGNTATYVDAALQDKDSIRVRITPNVAGPCANNTPILSDSIVMTVNPNLTPTISITSNAPGNAICNGSSIIFNTSVTNEGTAPIYQWKRNGVNVGTNTPSYTHNGLLNGDQISVEMTSNATCAVPAVLQSNVISVTVNPLIPTSVATNSDYGTSACQTILTTFTATPVNPGTNPTYQWQKNGANVGGNSAVYTDNTLANGDVIRVRMSSSVTCPTPATAASNSMNMKVNPLANPGISTSASPDSVGCEGREIIFSSHFTNGGPVQRYQWQVNGIDMGVDTFSTFKTNALADGDVVTCRFISSAVCAFPVTSMPLELHLLPKLPLSIVIMGVRVDDGILFQSDVQNGGTEPTYQWLKNNAAIPGETNATYHAKEIGNDKVSLRVGSNAVCADPLYALSNALEASRVTDVGQLAQQDITLSLYPNPNDGMFTIKGKINGTMNGAENNTIEVLNAIGQVIYKEQLHINSNEIDVTVSLGGNQAAGLYTVWLHVNGQTKNLKFAVTR